MHQEQEETHRLQQEKVQLEKERGTALRASTGTNLPMETATLVLTDNPIPAVQSPEQTHGASRGPAGPSRAAPGTPNSPLVPNLVKLYFIFC